MVRKSALALLLAALFVAQDAAAQLEPQPGLRDAEEEELLRKEQEKQRQPRLTKPPRLIYQIPPVYPEAARAERRQGTSVLRITIDDEGYVSRLDVLQSAGLDLDYAAMGAVANYVFEPAEVDDIPAPIQVDYKQAFVLKEEVKEVYTEPPPVETPVETPAEQPVEAPPEEVEVPIPGTVGYLNFLGVVRESGTKAPLADAEIFVIVEEMDEPISTVVDKAGRFELRGIPPGKHLVRVSATGYEQMATVEEFSEKEAVKAIYYLPRRSYNKFETVVRDRRGQKEVSRIALTREEVSQIPGTFGDPIRVIENLPGMQRAPLLGGALLVRGANPSNSGVYMDGVPIPILYHFLGLTSVVNAEFLETIDFYPGGFGARYGRATAGIVEVKSRDMKLRRCRGAGKVDLIDSGFFFGCPVTLWGPEVESDAPNWRRITFAAAARRSYLDALIPLFTSVFLPAGAGSLTAAPVYWDYQAKVEYRPLSQHTFSLFGFGSADELRVLSTGAASGLGINLRTTQTFHRALATWEWRMHPRVTNRFAPWVGYELQKLGFSGGAGGGNLGASFDVAITSWGLRDDFKYTVMDGLSLNAGIDVQGGAYALAAELPISGELSAFPRITPRLEGGGIKLKNSGGGVAYGTFVEAEIGPFAGLKVVPGFRLDVYEFEGRFNVSPMPRIAVRYEVMPGTTLKGAYGVYEQLSEPQTRIASTGNPRLWPERSRHHILGMEQRLTNKINVDFQVFYNRRNQLVVDSNRIESVNGGQVDLEVYSNDGIGASYGAEILLRHDLGKNFFGWIAYTLMRSEQRNKPKQNTFVTQYDQTHILTLVGQYKVPFHVPFREWSRTGRLPRGLWWNTGWAILSGDWSVGGRLRVVTGNPDTPVVSAVYDVDTDSFVSKSGGFRTTRLPTFHQLDIRVDYKMAFDNILVNTYVDFINVYNRPNAEFRAWDYRYRNSAWLALLPFIPVMGMSAEF